MVILSRFNQVNPLKWRVGTVPAKEPQIKGSTIQVHVTRKKWQSPCPPHPRTGATVWGRSSDEPASSHLSRTHGNYQAACLRYGFGFTMINSVLTVTSTVFAVDNVKPSGLVRYRIANRPD